MRHSLNREPLISFIFNSSTLAGCCSFWVVDSATGLSLYQTVPLKLKEMKIYMDILVK